MERGLQCVSVEALKRPMDVQIGGGTIKAWKVTRTAKAVTIVLPPETSLLIPGEKFEG